MLQNRRSIPKYFRISREIIARIQNRELAAGVRIPSENEIIKAYKVSNTTARKALQDIERLGWVTRVKGKGTFVRDSRVDRSATRILGFTRNMLEAGRRPSTRLLSVRTIKSRRSMVINGRRYALRGPFCEIQRLRYADGVPMMKEIRCISTRFCPGIEKKNLKGSLYEMYERDYGIRMVEIDQMLSAEILEGEELGFFEVDAPIPAFRVEGVTFCGKELVLEMENSLYRGDMYRFLVKAVPHATKTCRLRSQYPSSERRISRRHNPSWNQDQNAYSPHRPHAVPPENSG